MARSVNLKRDRFLFYVGLVLFLVGGPGLVVGTFAHDSLRVPVGGGAYDAFGWVNQTALGIGIVLLLVGIMFLFLALRGGIVSEAQAREIGLGRSRT